MLKNLVLAPEENVGIYYAESNGMSHKSTLIATHIDGINNLVIQDDTRVTAMVSSPSLQGHNNVLTMVEALGASGFNIVRINYA
jgi:hypothetical protein